MDSRTERSGSSADEGKGLSADLAAETAVDLPDREAMSTISGDFGDGIDNFAMPINTAEAANLYSDGSMAVAIPLAVSLPIPVAGAGAGRPAGRARTIHDHHPITEGRTMHDQPDDATESATTTEAGDGPGAGPLPPDPVPLAGAGGPVGGPVAGEVLDPLGQPLISPAEPSEGSSS
jgi:hypothetical protein